MSQPGSDRRFLDVGDLESWDDERLLRSRSAPEETFATFYRRHVRVVLGFYSRRGVDVTVAGDLTAETFAAALLARYRYRPQHPGARPWLLTIAGNKLADHARSVARESSACERLKLERVTLDARGREDFSHLADECGADIAEALAQLPPAQRAAVESHVVQGDSYAQIAGATGSSESAVRQNVSRGLGRLRARLEKIR